MYKKLQGGYKVMIYEEMSIEEVVEYINKELLKGRTMKDIEVNDFGVNERVIGKRLARKKWMGNLCYKVVLKCPNINQSK